MSWLDKIVPSMGRIQRNDRRTSVPDGLWRKCPKCEGVFTSPSWISTRASVPSATIICA